LAAAAAVAVLVLVSAGGGPGPAGRTASAAVAAPSLRGAAEVRRELAGLAQAGGRLGRPGAPVRVTEFVDLQCPACALASREVVPEIVRGWVRPGVATLTLRPLAFIGPDSLRGAL